MAYSLEFRIAVADAYDKCRSSGQVAAQFGCSEAWVRRLIQRRRVANTLQPQSATRAPSFRLDQRDRQLLRELVSARPNMTLAELTKALENKASVTTVWRTACALGVRQKRVRPRLALD
jgi:transposase